MTDQLKELAGRSIIAGFDGHALTPWLTKAIEAGELGGIILFSLITSWVFGR